MKISNPINTVYKPQARINLKRLETACYKLNSYFGFSNKIYDCCNEPQPTYQISAAYGGYRLEFWNGDGGAQDQTHRTTAKELYVIIISILAGLTVNHSIKDNYNNRQQFFCLNHGFKQEAKK